MGSIPTMRLSTSPQPKSGACHRHHSTEMYAAVHPPRRSPEWWRCESRAPRKATPSNTNTGGDVLQEREDEDVEIPVRMRLERMSEHGDRRSPPPPRRP